jgi:predicted RNA-binding Zn ribbon-like protein
MSIAPERAEPFQLFAGNVALDFVNTLDDRYAPKGPTELLTSYERLLAFCEQAGLLNSLEARRLKRSAGESNTQAVLTRAKGLREALFAVFTTASQGAAPPDAALDTLNELLAEMHHSRVIVWDASRYIWQSESTDLEPTTPLGRIAEAAAALLTSADANHIKECGSATCRWFFLDRSRNHSRRWCDMKTCGNRTKARRFHARERESES